MKNTIFIISIFLTLACCSKKQETSQIKGLVSFRSFPGYQNEKIIFRAQIELPSSGVPVTLEYIIMEDSLLVDSGHVLACYDDEFNTFFETALVSIPLPAEKYHGKKLKILLDPDLKNTLPMYSTLAYLPYRMAEVRIP